MPAATTNNPEEGYALFDTAIGRCAIIWSGGAIVGTALPESSDALMRRRIASRFPDIGEAAPPAFVQVALARIAGHLAGEKNDLSDLPVALAGSAFDRAVWEAAARIPCGEVRSYGEIARGIGAPDAAQAVGVALGRNPVPVIVPCHRVLAGNGRSGGFSAPGGVETKFRILALEGARRRGEPQLFETLPLAVKPARR